MLASAAALLAFVVAFVGPGAASSAPNAPVATTAVPSAFLTITDQNGANDVPGQGDLTQMGRDDSDPSVYRIFWSWDDTASWTGAGNTGDACALFDTNGDGRTDYQVCGQIFNPNATTVTQTAASPAPYSCTPSNANAVDRCQNPVPQSFSPTDIQAGTLTTPPAAPGAGNLITNTDPFPTGSNFPFDSTLQVVIRKGFLPAGAVLTNVCSHPSIAGGANNTPTDCIAPPASGLLVIRKDAGADTSTPFVFTPTPNPNPIPTFTVPGTGQTNPISLLIGTSSESVSEAVPAGWALTAGSCQLSNGTSTGTFDDAGNRITGITIQSGLVTTCTFTDVNKPALTVSKDNDANHDSVFTDTETVPANATYPYTVTYQATIRNSAASPATITISDNKVPAPLRSAASGDIDCADVATIAAGATVVCRYDKVFADASQAQVVNTVSVTASNSAGNDTKTDTSTVNFSQVRALSLTKAGRPATYSQPGQTINYTYVVTNTGNVPLTGPVTVSDDKATVSCPPDAVLGVNQSLTCTASHVVTQADIDAGSVTNTATAHAGSTNSNQATATVNAVASSGLSLIKSATPSTYGAVGAQISYSYAVKNIGNVTLAGPVTVTDDKATVTCPAGGLTPGATTTCTATHSVTQADLDAGFVTNHAMAHANGIDSNDDSRTVTAVQQRSLSLVKSAVQAIYRTISAQIAYTYVVKNTGNVTLRGPVSVSDDKVAVSCPAGDLAPGASITCTALYSLIQSDLDAGSVVNHATAQADGVASNPDSQTVPLVRAPGLTLTKAAGTAFQSPPLAGDRIHYSFTIENTGNVTLTGVNLTDALVGFTNVSCGAATLAPQVTTNCTADYRLTQADVDAGHRANSAAACGTPPPGATPSPTCDAKATDTPITRSPAMTLAKSSTTASITAAGQGVPYTYVVTNTGNVTLHNVGVTDDRVTSVSCPQSTLAPGDSETCTGSHTVTQAEVDLGGNLVNNATAHSTEAPDASAQLSIPILQAPLALKLVKSASPQTYDHVGQAIAYTYTITNTGNVTVLGQITVTDDTLPSVSCPPSASLAPDASITCTASHTITQADLDAGSITNTASASNGVVTSPEDTAVVRAVQSPALAVAKSSTTTSVSAPQTVAYSYLVTNTGNVTLTGILLSDNNDNDNLSCPGASLPPGGTMTCTASHAFTQAELDANGSPTPGTGRLANMVTATSIQAPPATDSLSIPIVVTRALTLAKSATPSNYDHVGQVISYTYLVRNTGNVTIAGPFSVSDDKLPSVSCPPTVALVPGASITCTASHTVTQSDLDSGSITNVASASAGGATSPTDTATVVADVVPALSVKKSSTTTSLSSAPTTVDYSYLVTNTGNVTLAGIALTDDNVAGSVTCPLTTLTPGEAMTCSATHTFTQSELDAGGSPVAGSGVLANTVTARSDRTAPVTDSLAIPVRQREGLTLLKSADPLSYDSVGQQITYTYLVTNTGNVTLTGQTAVTDDRLPAVTCPLSGALAPGQSLACTATYSVTQADLDAGEIVNAAFATLGAVTSPTDTATVDASQKRSLIVVKSSPTPSLSSPQAVDYSYVVTNTGNTTASGIVLSDDNADAPPSCPAPNLAPGETMTCTASHTFTQAELDANGSPVAGSGVLANTVTVTSNQAGGATDSLSIPIEQSPSLGLVKSATPTSYDHVGEVIAYTYVVTNTGNVTIDGQFSVTDDKVSVTCPVSTSLPPGASTTCTASHTITQADLDAGKIVNVASASNGVVTSPPDTVTLVAEVAPALTLAKSSTTTSLSAPGTVTYSYLVRNTGNVTVTGISLADNNVSGSVDCPGTSLATGASMTCTASHTFTQAELDANGSPTAGSSVLANSVTLTSIQAPPVSDSLSIPIMQAPALQLAKSATPISYRQVRELITYTYRVTNTGNVTVLGQISVTDNKVLVTCPPSTGLAPGASLTCTASHTVTQADLDAGSITNVASASNGVLTSPIDTATVDATQLPSLSIAKTSPTTSLSAPQPVSYDYLVVNTGNVTVTGIALSDDNTTGPVGCPKTSLAPGASMTCTASHAFTQTELDANGSPTAGSGELANTVTASSDQAPDVTAGLSIPIDQTPALTLVKSASPLSYDHVAQVISYTYVVTNTGNVTLLGQITVTDDRLGVLCPPTSSLAPGDSLTCTASYAVTQADLDAGQIVNVASASNGVVKSPPDRATVAASAAPLLSMVKSSPTTSLSAPQTVSYSYLVTNEGNVTVTGIALSDDNVGSAPSCPATLLAPRVSMTCTATHVFTQAELDANGSPNAGSGALVNNVTATSNEAPPATGKLEIPIVPAPKLTLVKSASPLSYNEVGELISYGYDVENTGNVTVLGQITVTDDQVTVTCPPSAALAPGDSITCTASHAVTQADLDAGSITNVASASNGVVTSNTDTVTVDAIAAARLSVIKSSPTTLLTAPQTVTYSYLVTNVGNITVNGIALTDDNIAGTVSCPRTTLAPNEFMTCTAAHAFTQAELDANGSPTAKSGLLVNHVTATSAEAPDATDDLLIPIAQTPELTLLKSATPTSYDHVGQVISYTYTVTNTGNVTLLGALTVTDDKLTVACPPSVALAPGDSIVCTASHAIVQADLDAGEIVNVASASNGVVTSPPDTARVEAVQNPRLVVVKSSPTPNLSAPQTVDYSYLVRNTGNVTLTGISLSDDNDNDDLACPQTTLAPSGTMICTATHTFTQAELDANGSPTAGSSQLVNHVTATSDQAPPATDTFVIPIVQTPELTLVKSASPLSYDHVGQAVSYTYAVTNTGNITVLGAITVTDDKVTVVCPPSAALAPGASITCTASHTITQTDLDSGKIVNVATASNGVITSPPDTATVQAVQKPLLFVGKSSSTKSLSSPQTVGYSYFVENTGNVTVTGIVLVDDNVGGGVTCPFTTLAPGASMTCTASHLFTQAELDADGSPTPGSGRLRNFVTASSNEAAEVTDALAIPIVQSPELTLVKSPSPDSYDHVGELITYTYDVTNTGNVTLTGQVSVADDKVAVTCPATTSLAPGDTIACTATHTITQTDLDAGQIVNTASATVGGVTSLPDTVTVGSIAKPVLSVVKSSQTTGLTSPQTVQYSYLVSNTGNVTLTGIALTDDNVSGTVSCPATTLAPGVTMTCTASHAFTQAELDADGAPTAGSGFLENKVTATSNQAAPATDTLAIPITQRPQLHLVKTGVLDKTVVAPPEHANPGDRIDYTLTATNVGNVTLHDVSIADPLLGLSCTPAQPATLAPGAQLVCTGGYTVTQADLNDGSVTNHGAVIGTTPGGQPIGDTDTSTVLLPPDESITLAKSAAESAFHLVGDVLHYSYVVKNTGNVRLSGPVNVADDKATVTCPSLTTIGNHDSFLDPGESLTCTATYTVTASDLAAGKVTNVAAADVGGTVSDQQTVTVAFAKLSSQTATDVHDAQHNVVTTVPAGSVVHDFVAVAGQPEAPTPTGAVSIDWFTNSSCSGAAAASSGAFALDAAGHVHATGFPQGPLAAGLYGFRAHYEGDALYEASNGPCEPLRVVDANIQIGPSATNRVGATHTFTAHVNVNDGTGFVSAPAGTAIAFTIVSGPGAFTSATPCVTTGATGSCTITLVSNVTGATIVRAQATVAVSGVSLTRQTDGTGSSSGPATKNWAAATARTDVVTSAGTVTTSVTAGAVVHDTVFVAKAAGTPDAAPAPTGNVVFHRYATLDCTGTSTDQTVPLTPGNPSTASSDNFAPTASISFQAAYLGDASYAPVIGACEPLTVTPVPLPGIAIVKNPAKQTVAAGGTAKFKITVTNTGNTVLTNVIVRDPAATSCKRTSAEIPALASMSPGASVTYSCTKPGVGASFTNVAKAYATTPAGALVSASDSAAIKVQPLKPKKRPKPKPKTKAHQKPKSTG